MVDSKTIKTIEEEVKKKIFDFLKNKGVLETEIECSLVERKPDLKILKFNFRSPYYFLLEENEIKEILCHNGIIANNLDTKTNEEDTIFLFNDDIDIIITITVASISEDNLIFISLAF